MSGHRLRALVALATVLATGLGAAARTTAACDPASPAVAIVLDDMGYRGHDGRRALALPGAVTYAFLPHAPHTRTLAMAARAAGREVMLHLPMQAAARNDLLGPGALLSAMDHDTLQRVLDEDLAALPEAVGVNNHMGSVLTADADAMRSLMRTLRARGLYFVDSRTTGSSVAAISAANVGVAHWSRDVFLDPGEADAAVVERQLRRLVARARRTGCALAIGHPFPQTLSVLESWLPRLAAEGVELVGVTELLLRDGQRPTLAMARRGGG